MKPPFRHIGPVINTYLFLRKRGNTRRQAVRTIWRALLELFDIWLLIGIEKQRRNNRRRR